MNTLNDLINHLVALKALDIEDLVSLNRDIAKNPDLVDYYINELTKMRRPYID